MHRCAHAYVTNPINDANRFIDWLRMSMHVTWSTTYFFCSVSAVILGRKKISREIVIIGSFAKYVSCFFK